MYETTRKSLIRFVTDQIAAIQTAGISPSLSYVDFDAHGDLTTLPPNDVVGLHAFTIHDEDQLQHTIFGITVSTYNDPNLLIQNKVINWFYNKLRVRNHIPLLDPSSGSAIGEIIMGVGASTMPVERSDTRAATFIQANGTVTLFHP